MNDPIERLVTDAFGDAVALVTRSMNGEHILGDPTVTFRELALVGIVKGCLGMSAEFAKAAGLDRTDEWMWQTLAQSLYSVAADREAER